MLRESGRGPTVQSNTFLKARSRTGSPPASRPSSKGPGIVPQVLEREVEHGDNTPVVDRDCCEAGLTAAERPEAGIAAVDRPGPGPGVPARARPPQGGR